MPRRAQAISIDSVQEADAPVSRLLKRMASKRHGVVIARNGKPAAVLVSVLEYARLASPEPEVLRLLGEDSRRQGTDRLNAKQIDRVIRSVRASRSKRT